MARFTQYHYNEIARILRTYSYGLQNKTLCSAFETVFKDDNPRFKPDMWTKACKSLR